MKSPPRRGRSTTGSRPRTPSAGAWSITFPSGEHVPSLNLDLDYFDHPKTKRLIARLGPGAEAFPIRVWAYAGKYHAEDGVLRGYDAAELAGLAGLPGDPEKVVGALVAVGFLLKTPEGWACKDWLEHEGHLAAFKERSRKANASRWESLRGKQGIHHGDKGASSGSPPTLPSKPTEPPPPFIPQLVGKFLRTYPTRAERPGGRERAIKIGERGKAALVDAMIARPDYPWIRAALYELNKARGGNGGQARDLLNFLADLPVPEELPAEAITIEAQVVKIPTSTPEQDAEAETLFFAGLKKLGITEWQGRKIA